jgi:uncharacterized protein
MSPDLSGQAFRQFVVKVHSRCNLACDHCYMYEHADQSWRRRPVVMSDETIRRTAQRVAEHCRDHRLPAVHVVFHGGEPLLAGTARLARLARLLREGVPEGCDLHLGIQTNGILLNEELCELFLAEQIKVGVSLDGDEASNDRHRRYANGRSSYTAVVEAVRLLNQPRFRPVFSGLLCTIDPMNDPLDVYQALCALDPPAIDFLLPHATWADPPRRPAPEATPYADWLLAIHERWRAEPGRVRVRTFDAIDSLVGGTGSLTESLGLDDPDLAVVETDGAIEQADSLKTAYEGAPSTGLNVHDHSFDEARRHPGFGARSGGAGSLCAECRSCAVVDICGGGLYAHRYRPGTGFDNPSVYCQDLYRLVDEVGTRPAGGGSPPVTHTLAERHFDELATGGGSPGAIDALTTAQRSLRRARLAASIGQVVPTDPAGASVHAAWDALCDLDESAPAAVEVVLGHPYLGRWASELTSGGGGAAYLWGAVLAASMVAGIPWSAKVPIAGDRLVLPTLGALVGLGTAGESVIETDPAAGALMIDGRLVPLSDERVPDAPWWPATRVELCGTPVVLDDVDPHRDCFHRRAAARLDATAFEHWRHAVGAAGRVIQRDHAEHLPALTRGLTTLTPLEAGPTDASATHRHAFGAIGVAATATPANLPDALVLALVHEVQHLKMGAVLDLFELFDPDDRSLHRVGWREDPRPIEGVLQGAYAHLAVVEVWRRRAERPGAGDRAERPGAGDLAERPGAGDLAGTAFATLRDQTRAAIDTLLSSGSLTVLGRRWVEQMRASACGTSS